jgi:hypothetical protein
VVLRYLVPNVMPTVIIPATIGLGGVILAESALSFLGFGVPPPHPSWGAMLSGSGRTYMFRAPWMQCGRAWLSRSPPSASTCSAMPSATCWTRACGARSSGSRLRRSHSAQRDPGSGRAYGQDQRAEDHGPSSHEHRPRAPSRARSTRRARRRASRGPTRNRDADVCRDAGLACRSREDLRLFPDPLSSTSPSARWLGLSWPRRLARTCAESNPSIMPSPKILDWKYAITRASPRTP